MEANEFVEKLKANGSDKDLCDLIKVYEDYKTILANLAAKNRGCFSLNVLCILCRNLDKVPSWSARVDSNALLALSIDCVRETRCLEKPDKVKTLACIYHIHKYTVKQKSPKPQLVLKIAYMAFENYAKDLLNEYCKTYWNIFADRLYYIEKLKTERVPITKLLEKLIEDVQKIIQMYDSLQFCSTIIQFLFKKLLFLYSEQPERLNKYFGEIFETLAKKNDLKSFKTLQSNVLIDLYRKFNDCFYVIIENASALNFKDATLNLAVRFCISVFGHRPDFYHCLQSIYLNGICSLLNETTDHTFMETIFDNLIISCEATERLSYKKVIEATYPYLNRFLRFFIEYSVGKEEKFKASIQESCLKLMQFMINKLKMCDQLLRCDRCDVKSATHDALQMSFVAKSLITLSLKQNIDITTILPAYFSITESQEECLTDLRTSGCSNYEKLYKKYQTDIHNTAILLNKAKYYEYSIKLFDVYLKNEIKHFKIESEMKNISRALYNKSICELDFKLYEHGLKDAYLSLIFAYPESLNSNKYMSLVIDTKSKAFKAKEDIQDDDQGLQLTSVLNTCIMSIEDQRYGNLKPFFLNLKFSELLRHEFLIYTKLWPALMPVAGVWRSLYELTRTPLKWLTVHDKEILDTLYDVILETPTVVKTIHSEYYSKIVEELIENFNKCPPDSTHLKMIHATLLFLKSEYDLHEASQKYGWKVTESNLDPDQASASRTLPQEHEAIKRAITAVDMWTDIGKDLKTVPKTPSVGRALQLAQLFVPQLLHLCRTGPGLQLAHVCCQIAQHIGDSQTYVRNAGTIAYHAGASAPVEGLLRSAGRLCGELMKTQDALETALVFLCDWAIYNARGGATGAAARLVQIAQARILHASRHQTDVSLDLATGRLLEAQTRLCQAGPTTLTAVNGTQRHYLSAAATGHKWTSRRLQTLTLKRHIGAASVSAVVTSKALLMWRRARAAAGAGLPSASALTQAVLYAAITNTHAVDDAQTKIDNRLKHILGLQPSNETQPHYQSTEQKIQQFVPKPEIETMLENFTFKKTQTSPSLPCLSVPAFKVPEFLRHDSNCQCYACQTPRCQILTCQTNGLEASMYFRAKEFDIAKNYFEGTLKCFDSVEGRLKVLMKAYRRKFENYIVDIVEKSCDIELKNIQLEILIEAAFFELSQDNFKMADEFAVRIYEIMKDASEIDGYLHNEVLNLMTTSAKLRQVIEKPIDTGLEAEFEALKLSPVKSEVAPKTPESKAKKPPKLPKLIVKDDEVPKTRRKPIKLNLDEVSNENEANIRRTSKRTAFKVPEPVNTKPELENLTPKPRSIPKTIVTQTTEDRIDFETPKPKSEHKVEFFTPLATPSEQFFTPMSTLRTYSKKKLVRQAVVKNLECEFLTPKVEKENFPRDSNDTPNVGPNSEKDKKSTRQIGRNSERTLKGDDKSTKSRIDAENNNASTNSKVKTDSATKLKANDTKNGNSTEMGDQAAEISKVTSDRSKFGFKSGLDVSNRFKNESKPAKTDLVDKSTSNMTVKSKIGTKSSKTDLLVEKSSLDITNRNARSKVETGSLKSLNDRVLKRNTSPVKLDVNKESSRPSRLRKPIRLSNDNDTDKTDK